jgi:hypothetical protein
MTVDKNQKAAPWWSRTWRWLAELETAMERTPTDYLLARLVALEQRVDALTARVPAPSGKGDALPRE